MKHFFKDKSSELSTLSQNKKNGKDAERHINSLLSIALNARTIFTSRTEDDAKIDVITAFSHPWINNDVQVIATQIKSGLSFCSLQAGKLVLIKNKFRDLLKRNSWILVCWTTVDSNVSYWFLIKPNSKFIKLEYNSNHIINPLTKFHLIRIIYSISRKDGGKGLIFKRKNINQEYSNNDYQKLILTAKEKYNRLKKSKILNPVFGEIEFTRLGWRHITRFGRWRDFKTASFEAIQILSNLMEVAPSNHYILKNFINEIDNFMYVENEYLLSYSEVKVYDDETKTTAKVTVFIKLLEIGCYHSNWTSSTERNNFVSRRVIFKSIYYKQSS